MNEKHPNRKKDKHNPYTLMIVEGRYYLSFKDGRGVMQNIEIEKVLYDLFNRFELEDISYLNRVSRHIEHSELTENSLNDRVFYNGTPVQSQSERDKTVAGNEGGSGRPSVGVELPWRQFAADRLATSHSISGCRGQIEMLLS